MNIQRQHKTIRLKNFDYSFQGSYFITICCQNRQPLFGKINNHKMALNPAGQMIQKWWQKIPDKFLGSTTDEFIIMPDHIHGIVSIGSTPCGRTVPRSPDGHMGPSLQNIIAWFKTMSTNEYIRNVKTNGWQYFDGKLWQRSYYDRFIRNMHEHKRITEYIINNPKNHK
jgi:REP element-mobilizing transposase RayT